MIEQLPAAVVLLPLVISFAVFICGWWKGTGFLLTIAALAADSLLSLVLMLRIFETGPLNYHMGGWDPPWGIAYRVDYLNAIMLFLIPFVALFSALHSRSIVKKNLAGKKISIFYSLYLLFVTGLEGICITADMFNLFVLLEVTSLSCYALVAVAGKRALFSSFRYLIIGTIGACFYLLGTGYLYIATGSLNMSDLFALISDLYASRTIKTGFIFILVGLGMKMAVFPLHVWLPDAYSDAPSPASAVMAPLMTKVMAYAAIRIIFSVFSVPAMTRIWSIDSLLVAAGTASIIFGAAMALRQKRLRRMLSYIIIAEIGYIIGGIGIANRQALIGAIFHIINDALMMTLMFMIAAQVEEITGKRSISAFAGAFKKMPAVAVLFTAGAFAVIGVPPFGGFFSKWYLIAGGITAGRWIFVAALLACTLAFIAIFFRIFDMALFEKSTGTQSTDMKESVLMPVCCTILAAAILLAGVFSDYIVKSCIGKAVDGFL